MDLNRCGRCGSFYVANGNVCPKCSVKDGVEFSTFKTYIKENGLQNSLESISGKTGISTKNLNRFLGYKEFKNFETELKKSEHLKGFGGVNANAQNNGIYFL